MTSGEPKLWIRFLEGTECFICVNGRRLADGSFEIMPDEAFDFDEDSILFQFGAGDVVKTEEHIFSDGTHGLLATSLVGEGSEQNICKRILFSILVDSPDIQGLVSRFGRGGVSRFWSENRNRRQIYPGIAEWLKKNEHALQETVA